MKPRLGAVSYLNTRPLVFALESACSPFALNYSVPSRCADDLACGAVDVGVIPSIEYARSIDPYFIVPGIGIGAHGEVLTVRLYHRVAVAKITRVALDLSSRTSVALVRVLLRERYGLDPAFVDAAPDLEAMLASADAALLIGDPVFAALDGIHKSLDLSAEWTELTGLPFVFAFWAGREDALDPALVQVLIAAKEKGLRHIDDIARTYHEESPGDPELYAHYLREHINFDLDVAALEGLHAFYEKAATHGLIAAAPDLRFYAMEDGP